MEEIWKPVRIEKNGVVYDYTGLYEVCNKEGKVRNVKTGKMLKPCDNKGYSMVVLCKNGKLRNFQVHRLVATAFIPNPENKPFVNHKDENKTNNCVDNLEWVTNKENLNYGTCRQRMSEAQKGKPKSEEAKQRMRGRKHSEETKRKISEALKGKRRSHKK